jgi:hypothetical protein
VYGDDRVFVHLRGADGYDELEGAARAIETAGHPVLTTRTEDAYALGREFLRWEIATAAAGAVVRINPFDEPNVAESKENTRAVLEDYVRAGRLPEPEPFAADNGLSLSADAAAAGSLREAEDRTAPGLAAAHLERAGPGRYVAIMAYVQRSEENDRLLERLRVAVRDATRAATTVGYGPRFLHSTGQLHKGGPDTGVFLQITGEDATDLDIPGESGYSFSTLKRAQALGDLEALQSRKRPILRVHLDEDVTANLRRLVAGVEATLSARKAAVE